VFAATLPHHSIGDGFYLFPTQFRIHWWHLPNVLLSLPDFSRHATDQ
jgi:hypothetical protein